MDSSIIDRVSSERLRHDLFFFSRDPFSFRTVMYTAPWHEKNSLDETDDAIEAEMKKFADSVTRFPNKVQAFRCNPSKPLHHWYDGPHDDDPWYDANNIEVVFKGTDKADEIIQLVSHKDSMSWINSPGAQDNATGLVANLELARVVSALPRRRTIRFLFCNEEHTPWHSRTYAKAARERGDNIIAVLNQDSLCGKSDEDMAAGVCTHAAVHSTPEGLELAEFIRDVALKCKLDLRVSVADKGIVNDDDGSFIKEGYCRTVMNIGSSPYADSQYHLRGDIPERVSIRNLTLSTQLILATVCELDRR